MVNTYKKGSLVTSAFSNLPLTSMKISLPDLANSRGTYPRPIALPKEGLMVPLVTSPMWFPSASQIG